MSGDPQHLGLGADEVLTTTRAVRRRLDLDRAVEDHLLEECVRIAVQAPSGRNRQHWDFVFVRDAATRSALADIWRRGLAAGLASSGSEQSRAAGDTDQWQRIADSLDHLAINLHRVPILLVPCVRVGDRRDLTSVRGQAGTWGSVLPAFWSFMLAARERGLGTAWTTAHLSLEQEAAELLGIPFDTVVQAGLTPVAHTVGTDFRPGPRADHTQFVHRDQWTNWVWSGR